MADLTLTAAQVAPAMYNNPEFLRAKAKVAITAGQAVFLNTTTFDADLAKADALGTAVVLGIAMQAAAVGQRFDVLVRGVLIGFALGSLTVGQIVYLSVATAGALQDAIPTTNGQVVVPMGRVFIGEDGTRGLFVNIDQSQNYKALTGAFGERWPV